MTYQLRVVAGVGTDVLRDATVDHPFGNHREPALLKGVRDPDEV